MARAFSVTVSSAPTRKTPHGRSVGSGIDDIIRTLSQVLGKKAVAALVGKDVRTIERWLKNPERAIGVEHERVLRDTFQIFEILTVRDGKHTARAWFLGMNPLLDDRAPIDLLIENGPRGAQAAIAAARSFANG